VGDYFNISKFKHCILIFISVLFSMIAFAQNNNAGEQSKNKFKILGSITAQTRFYNAKGIVNRRQPFIWRISGAPIIKSGEFKMPVLFTVGNIKGNYSQPFNRVSLIPTYKKFKGYLGFNRVNFSKYTLQGRTFLGAGFEFYPGLLRLGAVYGRFNKAVEIEPNDQLTGLQPNYSRWGYAFKLGIGSKNNYVDLIALKAKDDTTSIQNKPEYPVLTGEENVVIGLTTKQVFSKNVTFLADLATSGYTRNLNSREAELDLVDAFPFIRKIFNPKYASSISMAFSVQMVITVNSMKFTAGYERIDPEYRSFMAYFFTNDVRRITGSVRLPVFGRKLYLYVKGGLEQNNVSGDKFARSNRVVTMANANFTASRNFSLQANYSNFTLDQQIVRDVFTDSIKIAQVNQMANVTAIINLFQTREKHSITVSGNYQFLNDRSEANTGGGDYANITARVMYGVSLLQQNLSFKTGIIYNQFNYQLLNNDRKRLGADVDISKSFDKKKLVFGLRMAWYRAIESGRPVYNLLQPGVYGRYKVNRHHTFAFNTTWSTRTGLQEGEINFNELQGYINYRFTF
jgi:hypothetical protein